MRYLLFLLVYFFVYSMYNSNIEKSEYIYEETSEQSMIEAEVQAFELEEAKDQANIIAEITIMDKVKEIDKEIGMPYTVFQAQVNQVFKGNANPVITIKKDETSEVLVNSVEPFVKGEKYILFLKETMKIDAEYWIIGEQTGVFKVDNEEIHLKFPLSNVDDLGISYDVIEDADGWEIQIFDKVRFIKIIED